MAESTESSVWYTDRLRWGQTNLVETDPGRFDLDFWRGQWRRTQVQGLVVNCGGIAAYYPSRIAQHRWAPGVEHRDLFGEITAAARAEGLAVLARMDSSRAGPDVFAARPDWFAVDADGAPMMRGAKHATCVNSSYSTEFLPAVFTEVIERYGPDGFADNGWTGLDRSRICHCDACARSFHHWAGGAALPATVDWASSTYRSWIDWSYARRTELWEANNQVTTGLGGPHCRWIGMLHGPLIHNSENFQDVAAIAARTPMILLDHQRRFGREGFAAAAEVGLRLRGVLGEGKPVVASTAMYDLGRPVFRLSSMPAAEVRLWATHGFAGGRHPWWHHIGSVHEDRRQYETPVELFGWHRRHAALLTDREQVAEVGVVWSQRNLDLHGRDAPDRVVAATAGITRVLAEHQLVSTPVHVDRIAESGVRVLVLPDLAVLSDEQCAAVREFVAEGGSLLATGDSSLRDGDGSTRPDFGQADVLGVHATADELGGFDAPPTGLEHWERHSYLRLPDGDRAEHPALGGLTGTRTISFGGGLRRVTVEPDRDVLLTWIPPFPIFPPELAWMPTPRTDVPGLVVGEHSGSRVAYLPADLDRCFHRDEHPDHATVLAGTVRWLLGGAPTVEVDGPWPVAVQLYRNRSGQVLHLNSLLSTTSTPGRQTRTPAYGPLHVRVRTGSRALPRVAGYVQAGPLPATVSTAPDGTHTTAFVLAALDVHEVLTLSDGSPG